MAKRKKELPDGQDWVSWVSMSIGYLIVGWHSAGKSTPPGDVMEPVERFRQAFARNPFFFQTDIVVPGTLLAFSIEQTFKALAIRSHPRNTCLAVHDLLDLWLELSDEDQRGIAASTSRHSGTKREPNEVRQIVERHRLAFEGWRYFMQKQATGKDVGSLGLGELAQLAIGACLYAVDLHERGSQSAPVRVSPTQPD